MYTTIFFDLDDTLYDFGAASREAFHEVYELLDYARFFDSFEQYMQIYTPYNLELWKMYGNNQISKEELNKKRFSHPLESVGIHDTELSARFCKESLSRIPTKKRLIPGAIEILEYLYPKYTLYILSNGFKELQEHKMQTAGIRHYFKELILSDHIGFNKPHRKLFEYALQRSNSNLRESIMIGDMFETDIVGAANVGMDQIYLNRKENDKTGFKPTYEIKTLHEIKSIL